MGFDDILYLIIAAAVFFINMRNQQKKKAAKPQSSPPPLSDMFPLPVEIPQQVQKPSPPVETDALGRPIETIEKQLKDVEDIYRDYVPADSIENQLKNVEELEPDNPEVSLQPEIHHFEEYSHEDELTIDKKTSSQNVSAKQSNDLADFNLRKAVIYSTILEPKYF